PEHVPVITEEAGGNVLGKGDARTALDADVVVVVDPAEIVEAEMSGQRGRLRADALHQAPVAADGIDVVVEDLEARAVVATGEPPPGDRHADAGGDPLAQRAGGGLDARNPVILGVARSLAVELAEMADVVEGDGELSQALIFRVHRPCA